MRALLSDAARADCDFVVIGSSALRLQGWDVEPEDLDLFVPVDGCDCLLAAFGLSSASAEWFEEGSARRLEVDSERGPIDVYTAVSGDLGYDQVAAAAKTVQLGVDDLSVPVGSLEHVREMRSAVGRPSVPPDAVPVAEKSGALHVIAIDGPAGAGKSTVTRAVARQLGFTYLDTGAMYRSVTLAVLRRRTDTDDVAAVEGIARDSKISFKEERVYLDGIDVTDEIRTPIVTQATAHIAAYPEVRAAMVEEQRRLFRTGHFVAEGRDTGTVVAPDAPLKVYLTATAEERARRRSRETGEDVAGVLAAIEERDELDSKRKASALRAATDAVKIDTTGRPIDDVVAEIVDLARDRAIT